MTEWLVKGSKQLKSRGLFDAILEELDNFNYIFVVAGFNVIWEFTEITKILLYRKESQIQGTDFFLIVSNKLVLNVNIN